MGTKRGGSWPGRFRPPGRSPQRSPRARPRRSPHTAPKNGQADPIPSARRPQLPAGHQAQPAQPAGPLCRPRRRGGSSGHGQGREHPVVFPAVTDDDAMQGLGGEVRRWTPTTIGSTGSAPPAGTRCSSRWTARSARARAHRVRRAAQEAVERSRAFRLRQAQAEPGAEEHGGPAPDLAERQAEAAERLVAMEEVVNQMSNQVGEMLAEAGALQQRIRELEAQLGEPPRGEPRRRRARHLHPVE